MKYPTGGFDARNAGDKTGLVYPSANMNQKVFALDTTQPLFELPVNGDFLYADINSTGSASIQINDMAMPPLPFKANMALRGFPYKKLILSWASQPGKVLNLWYGYGAEIIPPNQDITSIGSITNPVTDQIYAQDATPVWQALQGRSDAVDGQPTIPGIALLAQARKMLFNGTTWDRQRTPIIFKQFSATPGAGVNNLWTPAAGKKFRLMGYNFTVLKTSKLGAAADVTFAITDNGTAIALKELFSLDTTTPAPAQGIAYQNTVNLGNGYLSAAANNVLQGQSSVAFSAGGINMLMWGTEE